MASRIDLLAQRLQDDPFFLAQALVDFRSSEGLDEAGLAARLGCATYKLGTLMLCRRPGQDPSRFREDIARIALRFGVRADILAEAVRRSDALRAMKRAADSEHGLLMAARDRKDAESDNTQSEGEDL